MLFSQRLMSPVLQPRLHLHVFAFVTTRTAFVSGLWPPIPTQVKSHRLVPSSMGACASEVTDFPSGWTHLGAHFSPWERAGGSDRLPSLRTGEQASPQQRYRLPCSCSHRTGLSSCCTWGRAEQGQPGCWPGVPTWHPTPHPLSTSLPSHGSPSLLQAHPPSFSPACASDLKDLKENRSQGGATWVVP